MLFSLKTLVYVAIFVSIATYVAVYNIDRLTWLFTSTRTLLRSITSSWRCPKSWRLETRQVLDLLKTRSRRLQPRTAIIARELVHLPRLCIAWPRAFVHRWRRWQPRHHTAAESHPEPWTAWTAEDEPSRRVEPWVGELQTSKPWTEEIRPSDGAEPWAGELQPSEGPKPGTDETDPSWGAELRVDEPEPEPGPEAPREIHSSQESYVAW